MSKLRCTNCLREIATRDLRRKIENRVKAIPPSELIVAAKMAPRVRCECGHVTTFLTGGRL